MSIAFANERIARWGARFGTGDCQGLLPKDSSLPRGSWVPLARGCLPKEGEIGIGEGEHEEMVEGGAETGVVELSVCRLRTPIAAMPTPHSSLARILLTSSSPSNPTPSRSPGVTPVQSFFFCRDPCSWRHQRRPDSRGDRSMRVPCGCQSEGGAELGGSVTGRGSRLSTLYW